jgi:hypothetical protein
VTTPERYGRETHVSTNVAGVSTVTSTPDGPGGDTPTDATMADTIQLAREAIGMSGNQQAHPATPEPRPADRSARPGTPAPPPPKSSLHNPGETTANPGGGNR